MSFRSTLVPLFFAGALAFVGASIARADDCQKRTEKADHNLHEAISKHGAGSPEAEHWRSELAAARSYCWEHDHRWWDEDGHRWHTEHDWDAHDHDH
jgi:hypothetical protein